jgi:hypothetical protein
MKSPTPHSFGETLRASRMGFGWYDRLSCWVRISPEGDGFRLHVVPHLRGTCPKTKHKMHVCWWDDDVTDTNPLDVCPALDAVAPGPAYVLTDDEGRVVAHGAAP